MAAAPLAINNLHTNDDENNTSQTHVVHVPAFVSFAELPHDDVYWCRDDCLHQAVKQFCREDGAPAVLAREAGQPAFVAEEVFRVKGQPR